ncbi:MAG TPA: DUF72 domain-containing protein [Actinomycetota bacterium]|nr:DUF72 domain-containing protein [Actinomycetota bacterium]
MGRLRVGTASWTDKTLLESGWYPREANTPEERLKFYASRFPVVEVDSTYYALPSERNAVLWTERTPNDFTFDVKAFSLMTGHPVLRRGLPKDLQKALPKEAGPRVSAKDVPEEVVDEAWEIFRRTLMPLHSAGKLGLVMFQYPQWFFPGRDSRQAILHARERLPDYEIAVEFRQGTWFKDEQATRKTLDFLREEAIPFVCVDMPQGFGTSVPPIAEATSDRFAVVRFHGRREETWTKKDVPPTERFRYDYSAEELEEWVPKVKALTEQAKETHALFNNCYRDYATRNAKDFGDLVAEAE